MSAKKYANAAEQQKAWREANKERVKEQAKKWNLANKGKYTKKKRAYQRTFNFTPSVKSELDKEDVFYIKNHIKAGVPFEIIANRACCDVSDIERIKSKLA